MLRNSLIKKTILAFLFSGGLLTTLFASTQLTNKQIKSHITQVFPNVNISSISDSPVSGLLQVTSDNDVVYVTQDGRYLIVGNIVSLDKDHTNLTEQYRKKLRLDLIHKIPANEEIVYKPKKIKHIVTVFTDVDCAYCRKLHRDIQQYLDKGIEIKYLPFPRSGKNTPSYYKAVTIWCAKGNERNKLLDQAKLTNDFKYNNNNQNCSSAVDTSLNLVGKLGLNGTPAFILSDGTLLPGYIPAQNLDALLTQMDMQNKKKS